MFNNPYNYILSRRKLDQNESGIIIVNQHFLILYNKILHMAAQGCGAVIELSSSIFRNAVRIDMLLLLTKYCLVLNYTCHLNVALFDYH